MTICHPIHQPLSSQEMLKLSRNQFKVNYHTCFTHLNFTLGQYTIHIDNTRYSLRETNRWPVNHTRLLIKLKHQSTTYLCSLKGVTPYKYAYGHNQILKYDYFLSSSLRIKTIGHTKFEDDLSQQITSWKDNLLENQRIPTQGSHLDYGSNQLFNMNNPLSSKDEHIANRHTRLSKVSKDVNLLTRGHQS